MPKLRRAFAEQSYLRWYVVECHWHEKPKDPELSGGYWSTYRRHGSNGPNALTLRQALELEDMLNREFTEEDGRDDS